MKTEHFTVLYSENTQFWPPKHADEPLADDAIAVSACVWHVTLRYVSRCAHACTKRWL